MADFSKQYCELSDMGYDGDFDIYEEWAKLQPGYGMNFICEGFGFYMIGKQETNDTVWVLDGNEWVDFDEMFLEVKSKL